MSSLLRRVEADVAPAVPAAVTAVTAAEPEAELPRTLLLAGPLRQGWAGAPAAAPVAASKVIGCADDPSSPVMPPTLFVPAVRNESTVIEGTTLKILDGGVR